MRLSLSRTWLIITFGLAALTLLLAWPVESRSGTNYVWTSNRLPFYEKAIEFLARHFQTKRLVEAIIAGEADSEGRLLRLLVWVGAHVRPTPGGFPVVDDHPFHILIRGYGAPDQRTEAFALLATYAGMPSEHVMLTTEAGRRVDLALVKVGRDTYVFDVVNQVAFFKADGGLADLATLRSHPGLIHQSATHPSVDAEMYRRLVASTDKLRPTFSRMEMQRPWRRATAEISEILFRGIR
jgi:hypothetical protein